MLASSIPPKFPVPFASAAGTANIRPIPVASQQSIQPGAASLTDGFVPLNFQAIAVGGVPPFGQDMNGILNQITLWNQWHSAGGPLKFDATFAAAIGGYPAGATVQSTSGHAIYESLQDNNSANPNTGSVLWRVSSCAWSAAATQATGSANIQIITLSPAPTSLTQLIGIPITINSQGTNTGAVTINPNGLGAIPVHLTAGVGFGPGVLSTNSAFTVVFDGTSFTLLSGLNNYFPVSKTQNGFISIPNGTAFPTIFQWGTLTSTNGSFAGFTIPFPNQCWSMTMTESQPSPATWGAGFPTMHCFNVIAGTPVTTFEHYSLSWQQLPTPGWISFPNSCNWQAIGN